MSLTNFCVSLFLCFVFIANAANLPAGTELQIRLTTTVTSEQPRGQPVSAVVIAPVILNGVQVLGPGATLSGTVTDVTPFRAATDGAAAQLAALRIGFTQIRSGAAPEIPLSCIIKSVDNTRETVDGTGVIRGIDPSQTYEAQIGKAISKLQGRSSGLASLLAGMQSVFLKQVEADIDYRPGVEMTVSLTAPLGWNAQSTRKYPAAIVPAAALAALVKSEPSRTLAQNPPEPSDITNIMLIGTQQEVQSAFEEAGWFRAAALSRSSKIETARALIEDRGYNEAPMSILYLDGRPPDLALQKQNDTFAMRHHIRIWRTQQMFQGKPVWIAAATHDIKITFSPESRNFTHGIDSHIDLEREKVVNDLVFTGTVHGLSMMPRAGVPKNPSNATGDLLLTDGRVAVLEF
jgi:hypothetical protein